MLVVSNRNLDRAQAQKGVGDHRMFGDHLNRKGANEIRFAHATRQDEAWRVELVPEPTKKNPANLPSRTEFEATLERCRAAGRHALLYAHGYGKSFEEALEQGWLLEQRYGVDVILFTWPSDPGGFLNKVVRYREIKRVAMASTGAFDRLLELIGSYSQALVFNRTSLVDCPATLNLMVYSMGSFLLQSYVSSALYGKETGIFTNVVLCQADCDNHGHETWLKNLAAGQRVYVTINERDKILGWSDANGQPDRLGRSTRGPRAENATYVDFTGGRGVGNAHQLWGEVANPRVERFFRGIFSGLRAELGDDFRFDAAHNLYRVQAT